jgi:crotonobetainyl-CoA:carnitine CoA-transferase CaiB-like acyl-CoA transferase
MRPAMSDPAKIPPGPLDGLLVIDLTRVLAGPYCTLVLAELGARVIKVERPGHGDDAREVGPFIGGKSAYFMSLNRGKESIALDLGVDGDRAIFERLVARADVLVENHRLACSRSTASAGRRCTRAGPDSCSRRSRASVRRVRTPAAPRSTWSCRRWAG